MLFFKSCMKCSTGTVELRQGIDGPEFKCLNCGYETPHLATESRELERIA